MEAWTHDTTILFGYALTKFSLKFKLKYDELKNYTLYIVVNGNREK